MRLLCLSNGHGEDIIALRILQALQQHPGCPKIEVLPIVGEGHVYQNAGFPLIGSVKAMPSGGFIYMDGRQLARDLQGGLIKLTLEQIKAVRSWAKEHKSSLILAVGDIVPMLFAWTSGAPFAFVGTAKSEYYLRDETGWLPRSSWWDDRIERSTGCIYQPWERWLMSRPQCKAVFPRDRITARTLQRFNIPAFDLGNPMMDGLETNDSLIPHPSSLIPPPLTLTLVPGSRPPEVFANWELILQALNGVVGERPVVCLAAIAPQLDLDELHQKLLQYRWQQTDTNTYTIGLGDKKSTLVLMPGRFAECIGRADVAIALAGTATEQFVGLGKPAIAIAGAGPQFTPAFAEAQTRLLGASVTLVEQPNQVGEALRSLLNNPDRLSAIAENGRRRMGEPGAANRIAQCLIQQMQKL
ncbi:MAG: lipid-A-disaccharide synthase-related protein [Myxacorys chilensis ATA2-1-KO14]|jgi:uncharacterized protein (TIGR03492 family)|nr:lipid-A-disaccharide synthase-related protein [Myxacorys chilensis ATA2-1-KO14]